MERKEKKGWKYRKVREKDLYQQRRRGIEKRTEITERKERGTEGSRSGKLEGKRRI